MFGDTDRSTHRLTAGVSGSGPCSRPTRFCSSGRAWSRAHIRF